MTKHGYHNVITDSYTFVLGHVLLDFSSVRFAGRRQPDGLVHDEGRHHHDGQQSETRKKHRVLGLSVGIFV